MSEKRSADDGKGSETVDVSNKRQKDDHSRSMQEEEGKASAAPTTIARPRSRDATRKLASLVKGRPMRPPNLSLDALKAVLEEACSELLPAPTDRSSDAEMWLYEQTGYPLHIFMENSRKRGDNNDTALEVVKLFVEKFPTVVLKKDPKRGMLPIHHAAYPERFSPSVMSLLLDKNAETALMLCDGEGKTALHYALDLSWNGEVRMEIVRMIVERVPESVKTPDKEGRLPLFELMRDIGEDSIIEATNFLLERYPQAAWAKSKDGSLALDGIIETLAEQDADSTRGLWEGLEDDEPHFETTAVSMLRANPVAIFSSGLWSDVVCAQYDYMEDETIEKRMNAMLKITFPEGIPATIHVPEQDDKYFLHLLTPLACKKKVDIVLDRIVDLHPETLQQADPQQHNRLPLHLLLCAKCEDKDNDGEGRVTAKTVQVQKWIQLFPASVGIKDGLGCSPLCLATFNDCELDTLYHLLRLEPNVVAEQFKR